MSVEGSDETEGIMLQHNDTTHLSTALFAMREIGSLCDLVIRFDGLKHELLAHSCVLAACSPILKSQIIVRNPDGDYRELHNMDIGLDIWEYVIHFMYTASVFIPASKQHLLSDVAEAAHRLQFDHLYNVVTEYQNVMDGLESENEGIIVKSEPVEEEEEDYEDDDLENIEEMEENYSDDVPSEVEEELVSDDEVMAELDIEIHTSENQPLTPQKMSDPLQCMVCTYKARTPKAFEKHIKIHNTDSEENPYECPECDRMFPSERAVRQHRHWHKKEGKFRCATCSHVAPSMKKLLIHNKTHPNKEECPIENCDFTAGKRGMLKNHLASEHGDVEKPFKCDSCDYAADSRALLRMHSESHRKTELHQCSVCPKRFKRARDVTRHEVSHNINKLACSMCDKKFNRKVYLEDHMRRDHHTGLLKCPVAGCNLGFATYDKVYRHKRIYHDNKAFVRTRRHMCMQCGQTFFTKSHLATHERSHNNIRPFSCDQCEKSFHQNSDLTKHKMIHSGVKPFLCSFCPYTTNRSGNLKSHEKRHRGGSCKICDFKFKTTDEYHQHLEFDHNIIATTASGRRKRKPTAASENNWNALVDQQELVQEISFEDQKTSDEESGSELESTPPANATFRVLEKSSAQHGSFAVERRVPRSAIIAELPADVGNFVSVAVQNVCTSADAMMSYRQQKPTQIITTTEPNSGRLQAVLQPNPLPITSVMDHAGDRHIPAHVEVKFLPDISQESLDTDPGSLGADIEVALCEEPGERVMVQENIVEAEVFTAAFDHSQE